MTGLDHVQLAMPPGGEAAADRVRVATAPPGEAAVRTIGYDGRMAHRPSIRFSVPKAATWSWARAVGVMATLVVAACSEAATRCNECTGTDVVTNNDCSPHDVLILYEVEIQGELYTLVCGGGPDEELTPHDYDRIVNCNGAVLLIDANVEEVRIRVRTFDGTWSSNGWQTVQTVFPAECGCQVWTIKVNGTCNIGGTDAGLPQNELGGLRGAGRQRGQVPSATTVMIGSACPECAWVPGQSEGLRASG